MIKFVVQPQKQQHHPHSEKNQGGRKQASPYNIVKYESEQSKHSIEKKKEGGKKRRGREEERREGREERREGEKKTNVDN